jgi:hypothetical protein
LKYLINLKINENKVNNYKTNLLIINFINYNKRVNNKTIKSINLINNKILSLFIKRGKKNMLINSIMLSIKDFYYIFFFSIDKNLNISTNDYLYFNEFRTQLLQSNNYLNIFSILLNTIIDLKPFFFLKSSIIEKKFRKKKDEKYMYKINYILSKNRINKSISFLYLSFFKIKSSKLRSRFLLLFLDIFLNYKKSYVYEYKISTYKKLFLN